MKKIIIYLSLLLCLFGCTTETYYLSSNLPSKKEGFTTESNPGFFTSKDKRTIKKFYRDNFNRTIHQQVNDINIGEKIPATAGRLPLRADLRRQLSKPTHGFIRYQVVNTIVSINLSNQLIVDKIDLRHL